MLVINNIILILIFVIILAVSLYIIFGISSPIGVEVNLQNQLRMCCPYFRATDCKDMTIICNQDTMESLGSIAAKLDMNINLVKDFCDC